jgi:SM-20-related protein
MLTEFSTRQATWPLLASPTIAEQLASQGYVVVDAALPIDLVRQLQTTAHEQLSNMGKPAGIGRANDFALNSAVRSDQICWLTSDDSTSAAYLQLMEQLRLYVNQHLLLGLFRYEAHYASYAPGAYYQKHRDAFKGARNRVLSTVLYLNDEWGSANGGELVLYADDNCTELLRCAPVFNRLVLFLSEEFPHEVLPAQAVRYSVAGWFRAA